VPIAPASFFEEELEAAVSKPRSSPSSFETLAAAAAHSPAPVARPAVRPAPAKKKSSEGGFWQSPISRGGVGATLISVILFGVRVGLRHAARDDAGAHAPTVSSFDPTAPPTRYQTLIRQMVSEMQQLCDLMESVHDQATLEAAAPKIREAAGRLEPITQEVDAIEKGNTRTAADVALANKLVPQLEGLNARIVAAGERNQALIDKNAPPTQPTPPAVFSR
jgi:hypothetical protein